MSFQSIVLIVATIILFLSLIVIGVMLKSGTNPIAWPPILANCPDYWTDVSGNGSICLNTKNLGTIGNDISMNFSVAPYTGSTGNCAKYNWAKGNGLSWDGITYGVPNPCSTTSS